MTECNFHTLLFQELQNLRQNYFLVNLEHFLGKLYLSVGEIQGIISQEEIDGKALIRALTNIAALVQYAAERFTPILPELQESEQFSLLKSVDKSLKNELIKIYTAIVDNVECDQEIQKDNFNYKLVYDSSFLDNIKRRLMELQNEEICTATRSL